MHAHLAHDLEALTNHVREVIKNFSQIAAGFALQHYRGDKKFHVHQGNAFGEVQQRIAHRQAEFLLFEKLAEFGRDWLANFVGDQLQRTGERVASTYCARQGIDRFGKQFLELLKALAATVGSERVRHDSPSITPTTVNNKDSFPESGLLT